MIIKKTMVMALGLLFLASAASALADDTPLRVSAQVVGNAHFERRFTFVPLRAELFCTNAPCPKSEPYWALVLQSAGIQYEMDHQFSMGATSAPELVEVLGTVIRPGSRVMLDGDVESLSETYAVVTHVKAASLVMDMEQ